MLVKILFCYFVILNFFSAGRDEKSLETFQVSPDGEIIAFLGNNGYINLVSSKVSEFLWLSSENGVFKDQRMPWVLLLYLLVELMKVLFGF